MTSFGPPLKDDDTQLAHTTSLAEHAHHWMIGKQDGPTSEGACKECGARRDFSNSFVRSYAYRPQPHA